MSEASDYQVEVHELAATPTAVIRKTVAWSEVATTLSHIYHEVHNVLVRSALEAHAVFARFDPQGARVAIEAGYTTDTPVRAAGEVEPSELPGGEAAVCIHVGPYDTLKEAYNALAAWMKAEGREPGGAPWEVYTTPPDEDPPVTEVFFPLKAAS
jgi:effector-binding domain-containing protein